MMPSALASSWPAAAAVMAELAAAPQRREHVRDCRGRVVTTGTGTGRVIRGDVAWLTNRANAAQSAGNDRLAASVWAAGHGEI
jgi:hypothetical protein